MDLFIEFDSRQLLFQTDISEARDYIAAAFRHMLVPEVESSAGRLALYSIPGGFSVASEQTINYTGIDFAHLLTMVKDEVRMQFMRGRPDLLWLHAGVIERSGGALLLSGPSGQGKSTLSTRLCEHGWKFLSDDIAPVRMDIDRVVPFPQTPVRRLHPGREVSPQDLRKLERESIDIEDDGVTRREADIRGIVFVRYEMGAPAALSRLPQGSAAIELLRNATNFWDHRISAVDRVADLARRVPMYTLVYDSPAEAASRLDDLW